MAARGGHLLAAEPSLNTRTRLFISTQPRPAAAGPGRRARARYTRWASSGSSVPYKPSGSVRGEERRWRRAHLPAALAHADDRSSAQVLE
jgi:hypothetical protein